MPDHAPHAQGSFVTTRWTLVMAARDQGAAGAAQALEQLCRDYWYPLYAFLRRQGCGAAEAQDLTQEFFAKVVGQNKLSAADRGRGRFRSFLTTSIKNLMLEELRRERAQKRGGDAVKFSLDAMEPEARFAAEPSHEDTPERAFDRAWAESVIEQVHKRLQAEHVALGEADRFEAMKSFLQSDRDLSRVPELAARFGLSDAGVKSAIHRIRRRYAALFREEIERTVGSPEEAEEEMRHLLEVLG